MRFQTAARYRGQARTAGLLRAARASQGLSGS